MIIFKPFKFLSFLTGYSAILQTLLPTSVFNSLSADVMITSSLLEERDQLTWIILNFSPWLFIKYVMTTSSLLEECELPPSHFFLLYYLVCIHARASKTMFALARGGSDTGSTNYFEIKFIKHERLGENP